MAKQIIGSVLMFLALAVIVFLVIMGINANWQYENNYSAFWNLADKASTISQKSDYIDKFVSALEGSNLQGQNANLIWQTNNTSFDQNMSALKSLQSRLHEIKTMDESSFAYQTAIQQITAQEQGQAQDMLDVFETCFWKVHYPYLYNIWGFLTIGGSILLGCIGGFVAFYDYL